MIKLIGNAVFLKDKKLVSAQQASAQEKSEGQKKTIIHDILTKHNTSGNADNLKIRFDLLASHDITYVGIIQTARASGMKQFNMPYILTNCHNSLCAVGGTINEDDHAFGLSAARKYGGIYVPPHMAVIHSYIRETVASGNKMILGSDSHTRYGALGAAGIGEGGPELVKQLLGRTYDIDYPEVIAVRLTGRPGRGVGPQDVALAIIGAVFSKGFVKNKVLEFIGDGISNLSVDFRSGIDVMTTETSCLTSIWMTDGTVRDYLEIHGRSGDYKELAPDEGAYYDGAVEVELSAIEPMIALPFHPANVYTIRELNANAGDILRKVEKDGAEVLGYPKNEFKLTDKIENGRIRADQGIIAGCAGGTFENICIAADIVKGHMAGNENSGFGLSVYPGSQPINLEITRNGAAADLIAAGATLRTAFCGPCFGAGDVPANNALSIRHTTRNFANREGSKPGEGQIASVALMDARSIAVSAINGGFITSAADYEIYAEKSYEYHYDPSPYRNKVYNGVGNPEPDYPLFFGPNIADWPVIDPLPENIVLEVASVINDAVTTTDELIPSGEASSYRSNPLKLAEYTLSRKDPGYVARAKKIQNMETERKKMSLSDLTDVSIYDDFWVMFKEIASLTGEDARTLAKTTGIGSAIYANKPGDGSAREQAASSQKVLGGQANLAREYATKRYRSNLINWGMLPFTVEPPQSAIFYDGDRIYIKNIREIVQKGERTVHATRIRLGKADDIVLSMPEMTEDERAIILAGCLINYYASQK